VVIGKPGEIAALRNAEEMRPQLKKNVGVALSFFCAESPPTKATAALLEKLGVAGDSVTELKYRGRGWPGYFAPVSAGDSEPRHKLTYRESWAFLQAFRPWSVQVWPDGTGELADISCGDPWYEEPDGDNPGFSLVVVRTEKGREVVKAAMAARYLHLTPAEPWKLVKSQEGLIRKKGAVWGRLLAMRLFGMPAPNLKAYGVFDCWLKLSWGEKLKSTIGSVRRIISRSLYRRLVLDQSTAVPTKAKVESGK
jgi:coenzyme F420 hydrogenase subunit beta